MSETTVQKQDQTQQISLNTLFGYLPSHIKKARLVEEHGIEKTTYYRDLKKPVGELPASRLSVYVSILNKHQPEHISLDALLQNELPAQRSLVTELGLTTHQISPFEGESLKGEGVELKGQKTSQP